MANTPSFIAYSAVPQGHSGKSRWREIGGAFAGQKGTLTVLLDAMPLSGKIVLLPPDMPPDDIAYNPIYARTPHR